LIVADMLELLALLGRDRAVWIGHDWGSPVVWNTASHHPEKAAGVASLCVPYIAAGFTVEKSPSRTWKLTPRRSRATASSGRTPGT
jgi:pimeloyl-ACP methyl ester carboxylesterase